MFTSPTGPRHGLEARGSIDFETSSQAVTKAALTPMAGFDAAEPSRGLRERQCVCAFGYTPARLTFIMCHRLSFQEEWINNIHKPFN